MTPTRKYPDWDRRMAAEIERQHSLPFEFGLHDCCMFAADVVQAMTGYDPADGIRATYTSATEAARILRRAGGMKELVSNMLDCNPSPPGAARRGDVCMMGKAEGFINNQLGICIGDSVLVAADACLFQRELSSAICCWRIE